MKLTKDELIAKVREHGGEEPDDFTISMLEDIADSFEETSADIAALQEAKDSIEAAYNALKKAYADRFVVTETETEESESEPDDENIETYDSIF